MGPRCWPIVLALAAPAHADERDSGASSAHKPGFVSEGKLTGDWGGVRERLFGPGVSLLATYAGEVFVSRAAGDGFAVAGVATVEIDLELGELAGRGLGRFYTSSFGIHGRGLSEQLGDVFGVSNNVAEPEVRLFEAWLDQPLGPFAVRAGLLAVDQEFVLAEQSGVLLNATFGIPAMFSYNITAPVYPIAALGASARYEADDVTVRAAIYDGDAPNWHGVPTGLGDDALALGEVTLAETLKVGAWHHMDRGCGWYAVLDRQLDDVVGAFARAAGSPDGPMTTYADAGVRVHPRSEHPHDLASVGLAFATGDDHDAQTVVEATYQWAAGDWLTLQPDVQVLLQRERTAIIGALRAVVVL